MIELRTPRGLPVKVAEVASEDPSPRFAIDEMRAIKEYYDTNGYVVVKSVFPANVCDTQRGLWEREVKPFRGNIYRQATGKLEKHVLNENGWVMNPILNLQSVDPRQFGQIPDTRHRGDARGAAPAGSVYRTTGGAAKDRPVHVF